MDDFQFRVGDKVVRFGRVYSIFKIQDEKIYFKPYFESYKNNSLICSIPVKNIQGNYIRKPASKEKLKLLFRKILNKPEEAEDLDLFETRAILNENNLAATLTIIKKLWLEKRKKLGILPGGKQSAFQQGMEQVVEEVALIKGLLLDKARIVIGTALDKSMEQKI